MSDYLKSAIKQFEYYKLLGEKTFSQIENEDIMWQFNENCNSIGTIVKHLAGNMNCRWKDFLSTDGEKESRKRDEEFENDITSRQQMLQTWNEGWKTLLDCLNSLKDTDLQTIIYIRNQGHTVTEAINRQLAHYAYHVGQIVFIGKMRAMHWTSLSIPKGSSETYNRIKFSAVKQRQHFTDEFLNSDEKS